MDTRPLPEIMTEIFLKRTHAPSPSDCWEWRGQRNKVGYGFLMVPSDRAPAGYTSMLAHRLAYTLYKGPIPTGLVIRHTCHIPHCVNPAHLLAGTQADNMKDKMAAGRWRGGPPHGESNNNAKLTDVQVAEMRAEYGGPQSRMRMKVGPTLRELAAKYGVGTSQVCRIVKGASRAP